MSEFSIKSVINDCGDNADEYVEITGVEPELGAVTPTAFVTIYDDGEAYATFHASQINDIIWALNDARLRWEA